MDNVIDLHKKEDGKAELNVDFKTALNTPLNFGLPEPLETAPTYKKPNLYKEIRWQFIKCSRLISTIFIRPVRDYLYRKASNRLVGELASLALRLNREDFHVFVHIHGHVERIKIEVCHGGWKKDCTKVTVLEGVLPGCCKYGKMKPKDIREAMKLLKSLSRLNKIVGR